MYQNFRQLDLQTLIDMLAEETQNYTNDYIVGNLQGTTSRRAMIDALIDEISVRKKAGALQQAR